ncbi:MAG: flavoprotein, partial [Pirellulaceae bacterium]
MPTLAPTSTAPSAPLVLAMTGASGAPYAVRLLQQLLLAGREIHWVMSPSAATVLLQEFGLRVAARHLDS